MNRREGQLRHLRHTLRHLLLALDFLISPARLRLLLTVVEALVLVYLPGPRPHSINNEDLIIAPKYFASQIDQTRPFPLFLVSLDVTTLRMSR